MEYVDTKSPINLFIGLFVVLFSNEQLVLINLRRPVRHHLLQECRDRLHPPPQQVLRESH